MGEKSSPCQNESRAANSIRPVCVRTGNVSASGARARDSECDCACQALCVAHTAGGWQGADRGSLAAAVPLTSSSCRPSSTWSGACSCLRKKHKVPQLQRSAHGISRHTGFHRDCASTAHRTSADGCRGEFEFRARQVYEARPPSHCCLILPLAACSAYATHEAPTDGHFA